MSEITIPQFIRILKQIKDSDNFYELRFDGRCTTIMPAVFDDGTIDGIDLCDLSLYSLEPEPELEDLCILSWREDKPNELKVHLRNYNGSYDDEPVTKICADKESIIINDKFNIYASLCCDIPFIDDIKN